ncbi:MAG TPA: 50S ribosomal protein L29 [Candidatus Moranbacteria bacterium]|nr:50S ribosomal protein L29 [Candidatus Moranbacteria bacterium]
MKVKELKDKNINELKNMLLEKQKKLRKLRFDISLKQVKNNREIRNEKRNVARLLTLINKKNG